MRIDKVKLTKWELTLTKWENTHRSHTDYELLIMTDLLWVITYSVLTYLQ